MIRPPEELTPAALADWLESSLLVGTTERLSDADVEDSLAESGAGDLEEYLANLRAEVHRREHEMVERYPIRRDGVGFSRKGKWDSFLP